jgi:hypothetical protein
MRSNKLRFKIDNPAEKMVKYINTDLKTDTTEEEYIWNIDDTTGIFYLLRKGNKGENNMKKIFEIYEGYGKFDSMELCTTIIKEDTLENREKIFEDEFGHWDGFMDKESFLNGKSDSVSCTRCGCDWDETTCGEIIVLTKEEKLLELKENYAKEVERVEYLFKE